MSTQLPRLTPNQHIRCNALIKRSCANYSDGLCLPLDCTCPQSVSYSLLCKYFRNAVLPADRNLTADILGGHRKNCVNCGAPFVPNSNRQKYCDQCGKLIHRKQKTRSENKRRSVDR